MRYADDFVLGFQHRSDAVRSARPWMSEADDPRDWRLYLEDMLEFAQQAAFSAQGMDQAAFVADRRTYDATLRNIDLIDEGATHIPAPARRAYPRVAWQRIAAEREGERAVLLKSRLTAALLCVNEWMTENHVQRVIFHLRNIAASGFARNREIHAYLAFTLSTTWRWGRPGMAPLAARCPSSFPSPGLKGV